MSHDPAHGLFLGLILMSLVHAVLPTHWLSFVLVARAQKWSRRRMLQVAMLSGLGHVLTTALVGFLAAAIGKGAQKAVESLETPLPAMILLAFGLYYLVEGWRRGGHKHCQHDHRDDPIQADRLAVGGLFIEMTLSPCETLIPIFFAAGGLPWSTLAIMALTTSGITLGAMGLLAYLGFTGYEKLVWPAIERNERTILGLLLMGLGVFAFFFR